MPTTITEQQLDEIRKHAMNDITREIACDGIEMTYEQLDDLGDDDVDWMRKRLELRLDRTDADVVRFWPVGTEITEDEIRGEVHS